MKKVEEQYGKSNHTWLMDRGIPTEETIKKMKDSGYQIKYLIGIPNCRLTKLEKKFLDKTWEEV